MMSLRVATFSVHGQNGAAVLCLLAFGDTALKSEFLLAFGAHKKGCDRDTFRAVFPSIWVSWDPQTRQNKGKRKMTTRPRFTPHKNSLPNS